MTRPALAVVPEPLCGQRTSARSSAFVCGLEQHGDETGHYFVGDSPGDGHHDDDQEDTR